MRIYTCAMKISLFILMLLIAVQLFSQIPKVMTRTKKEKSETVYIEKNDSLYLAIKQVAGPDLRRSAKRADRNSAEGKIRSEEMKSWNEEKKNKYQHLFQTSTRSYLEKVDMDFDTFMLLFPEFGNYDDTLLAKYDFRIRLSGTNEYIAEFWEDGLISNSEVNALIWAKKLLERFPEDDSTSTVNTVKETYAAARRAITEGMQPRYNKVMALLYTKEKNEIIFNDPFQAMIDFK
jgi:hypothetical protein